MQVAFYIPRSGCLMFDWNIPTCPHLLLFILYNSNNHNLVILHFLL